MYETAQKEGKRRKKDEKETFVTKVRRGTVTMGNIRLVYSIDLSQTPMVTLSSHSDAVVAVAWAADKAGHAYSASADHTILMWDLELAGEVSRSSWRAIENRCLLCADCEEH